MDVISKDFIVLNADVTTSDESIELAETFFKEKDYVVDGYASAAKSRERIYPTGLQTEGVSIAIPHTDPKYAKHTAVGCIIPKEPVEFIAMGTEDQPLSCEIIFPIIVSQAEEQVKMLKELMIIFNNPEALKTIRNAKRVEDVLEVLNVLNNKIQKVKEV